MKVLIFGDYFFFGRTRRACGGSWIDLETDALEAVDTIFVQAGALLRKVPSWRSKEALFAIGATQDDAEWTNHLKNPEKNPLPQPRSFFLSAAAVRKLNVLRKKHSFWQALWQLKARRWIEPQLKNWYYGQLRVLQLVTSVHVGGAEMMCVDLAKMPEAVGLVSWGRSHRTPLRKADWDFTELPEHQRLPRLLQIAAGMHVDLIHTHLMSAEINAAIERYFPVVTTIHNMPSGWPRGYDKSRPGHLVGCSRAVTAALGQGARTAWNGVPSIFSRGPRRKGKEISLVAVANFRAQKRLDRLPPILKALSTMGYKPKLTLIGEVHPTDVESKISYEKFWRSANKHRVQKKIEQIQTLDVKNVLAKSRIFVSVSAYEGLSLSQLEALSAGLPVVATDVGGAAEIRAEVKDGGYITLPVNSNARTFAKAIVEAAKLPRIDRLPYAFSNHAMRRRYLSIYHSVLCAGAPSDEVWLVTDNFSMGGAQSSARRLLTNLLPRQKVRAFTLNEIQPTEGSRDLISKGVPVEPLLGKTARDRAFSLVRRAAGRPPKALLFWNAMAHEKALIADALRVPIIDVSPGEMYFTDFGRLIEQPIEELPIRSSQDYGSLLTHAVTKFGREQKKMSKFLGLDAKVIPNGVTGIACTKRSFKKDLVFGTAARIAPHKRLDDLVEAFSKISAPLLIAGRIERGCEAYAAGLRKKSTPNIRWMGEMEIRKFLPMLDIFVMASEPAGCPNASLEAMCSGLPLIITDVGGANEQALPGLNGWLVPARNARAMQKAVLEAMKLSPEVLQVMSRASRHHAGHFSIEKMVERYSALF